MTIQEMDYRESEKLYEELALKGYSDVEIYYHCKARNGDAPQYLALQQKMGNALRAQGRDLG